MGGESGGTRVIGRLYKLGFKGEREREGLALGEESNVRKRTSCFQRVEVKIFIRHQERSSEGGAESKGERGGG